MAYKKLELKEPIYELQEKETARQYYFFNIFLHADMEITAFARSFEGAKKGNECKVDGEYIQLNFNPPKEATFRNWYTFCSWKIRKREYWKCKLNNIREELQKDLIQFFKEDSAKLMKSSKKDWDLDKEIDWDNKTPAHLKSKGKNDLATAHQKKIDTLLVESGMPNDITQTQSEVNMNVEADVKTESSTEIRLKRMQDLADKMKEMDYD